MAAARRKKKDPAQAITPGALEAAALSYLNRFDTSEKNLRHVLLRAVSRAERALERGDESIDARAIAAAREHVDALLVRYRASGLIDDARYAGTMAQSLRRRGTSARAIQHKLRARGVGGDDISAALSESDRDSDDAELEAARALVRRRRLGPHRPEAERAARREKDLGALARAGFSMAVACRALETSAVDDVE